MAKKLIVNCSTCDTRKVKEEVLATYDSVQINAAMVLTSEASRELLNKYQVNINCASVLDVPGDVKISTVNGSAQIKSTDTFTDEKKYLVVNGSVEIGAGTEKLLEQYIGILVNGSVIYPESLGSCLGMMTVNGSSNCYPDDAIVLKRSAVIDRTFALRARKNLYWSAKRMIFVDPKLDVRALVAKGATFSSKEVILAESMLEELIGQIDEKADILVVPDGTAVILDDVKVDNALLKHYGNKLYIAGDVKVPEEAEAALAQLEYLNIHGDVSVAEILKERLWETATELHGDINVLKVPREGRRISDMSSVRISRWLLEQEAKGIIVEDCAVVNLDEDIPPELILERLVLEDCGMVICSEEQECVVAAVSEDVAQIQTGEKADEEKSQQDAEIKTVNCAEYVM